MVNKKIIFIVFGIMLILSLASIVLKFTNQNDLSVDNEKKENYNDKNIQQQANPQITEPVDNEKKENYNDKNIQQQANPQVTDIVIMTNPVNLSYFAGITKFRSCFGHEFGFSSAFEGKEAKSSLKHYFIIKDEYFGKENTIPVYSAFNGIVLHKETELILIEQTPFKGWVIDFDHMIPNQELEVGSEVKAGEFLGYVNTKESHALDISLQAKNKSGYNNYDWYEGYESIFNHMSDEVYKEYTDKGINKENIIIPKAIRDAKPCPCDNNHPYPNSPYCRFFSIPFNSEGNGISF